MRQRGLFAVLLVALGCARCGSAPKPLPKQAHVHRSIASAPSSYWEDTTFEEPELPAVAFEREKLVRAELNERFEALPEPARDRLLARGVLAVDSAPETTLGEIYTALAKKRVPFVITLDVLFSIAFRSIERALDELDREVIAGAMAPILAATDVKLAAESRAARSDTARPYDIALGVIEVARKLLDPSVELPRPASADVGMELSHVLMHVGPAKSTLLARPIDYAAFDLQAALAPDDTRLPQFRAMTWLARAPLALGSEPAQGIDVAEARTQTRAAMLLSRAVSDAWSRLIAPKNFATGRGDDPGGREVLLTATSLGMDLRDEATIGNVVRVDKLRAMLLRDAGPTVEDTGGALATFRLLSPSAPEDARALARASTPTSLPQALAVGVALGSSEAKELLEEQKDKARADDVTQTLAGPTERHASIYASGLDAIATYITPSSFDAQRPWRETSAHNRRKLEVALAAWATLRHAVTPFARASANAVIDEPDVVYDDVAASIEPHPEAIARLVSLLRQARRGLVANGLRETGAGVQLLDRAALLLADALKITSAQALAALPPPLARALATMPSRLASLERHLGPAAAPLVVVTAADLATGRVLEDGTGAARELWLAVDVAGAPAAYIGARVPFVEKVSTLRSTDATWAKLQETAPPARPAWVEPFSAPQ
ncbi:MAG TPA: DUF3160 domain-containing protein [Polyangiaceae bacterium]|nr:DUF3160 domain-containing protein [Polyangiaceae bacterium]